MGAPPLPLALQKQGEEGKKKFLGSQNQPGDRDGWGGGGDGEPGKLTPHNPLCSFPLLMMPSIGKAHLQDRQQGSPWMKPLDEGDFDHMLIDMCF